MANLNKAIATNFIDSILPIYGNARTIKAPTWDESQKMFILDEYESAGGHRYYRGMRFCNRIVIVETVGLWHTSTYLNSIQIFAFDGEKLALIQKKDYDKAYRNERLVKEDCQTMLTDYLRAQAKLSGRIVPSEQLEAQAHQLLEASYTSFLSKDFETSLMKILPAIKADSHTDNLIKQIL